MFVCCARVMFVIVFVYFIYIYICLDVVFILNECYKARASSVSTDVLASQSLQIELWKAQQYANNIYVYNKDIILDHLWFLWRQQHSGASIYMTLQECMRVFLYLLKPISIYNDIIYFEHCLNRFKHSLRRSQPNRSGRKQIVINNSTVYSKLGCLGFRKRPFISHWQLLYY